MKILSFIFLIAASFQVAATENHNGFWFGTFAKKEMTDQFAFHLETQFRYNSSAGETSQLYYQFGVLHELNEKHTLGYFYAHSEAHNVREHLWMLQHNWKFGSLGNYAISGRGRYEARFVEDQSQDAGRLRYRIRVDQKEFNYVGLVVWNEYFLNTNETNWNGNDSNDRNRFFLGVKRSFHGDNNLEFGYMNQYIPRRTGDISEHLIVLYLSF